MEMKRLLMMVLRKSRCLAGGQKQKTKLLLVEEIVGNFGDEQFGDVVAEKFGDEKIRR